MMDPVSVVVRKGAGFPFSQWSDLKGRKGVTNAGESYGNTFDAYMASELTVARAAGVDKAYADLLAGQADYLIIGLYPGRDEASKLGIADKVEALPTEVVSAPMYVAFSKTSKCGALQPGFAAGIKTAVDDGAVRRLLDDASKAAAQ
jgi:polar amino acid transport system substrate-binding protein